MSFLIKKISLQHLNTDSYLFYYMEQENKSSYRKWIYGAIVVAGFSLGGTVHPRLKKERIEDANCVRIEYGSSQQALYFFDRDWDGVLDEFLIANYRNGKSLLSKEINAEDVSVQRVTPRFIEIPLIETPIKSVFDKKEFRTYSDKIMFMPFRK